MKKKVFAGVMIALLLLMGAVSLSSASVNSAVTIEGPTQIQPGETITLRITGLGEGTTADIQVAGLEYISCTGGLSDETSVLLLADYGGMTATYQYRVIVEDGQSVGMYLTNILTSANMVDTPQPNVEWTRVVGQGAAAPSSSASVQPSASPGSDNSAEPSSGASSGTSAQPSSNPSSGTSEQPSSNPSAGTSEQPGTSPSAGTSEQPSTNPGESPGAAESPGASSGTSEQPGTVSEQPGASPSAGTSADTNQPQISAGTPSSGTNTTAGATNNQAGTITTDGGSDNNNNNNNNNNGNVNHYYGNLPKTADATTNMWLFATLAGIIGVIAIIAAKKCLLVGHAKHE